MSKRRRDTHDITSTENPSRLSDVGIFLNQFSEKAFSFPALNSGFCDIDAILRTMDELKEAPFYQLDESPYEPEKIREVADAALAACVDLLRERNVPESLYETSTDKLNRYFLYALFDLQRGNYRDALRSLLIYDSYGDAIFRAYPHLFYYRGLAWYGQKKYERARKDLETYLRYMSKDEIAHFHLGNLFLRQRKPKEALDEYLIALESHQDFPEILFNAAIIEKSFIEKKTAPDLLDLRENPLSSTLVIPDDTNIWEIPIFINNFNRLGCLKTLVHWLIRAGYRNIWVMDNDSTYPPLLEYYSQMEEEAGSVRIYRLGKNLGHTALWDSGILEKLRVKGVYVYTDSDVVPSCHCPTDFLQHLLDVLRRYPFLKKVGLGLHTEDITYFDAEKTKEMEKRFYLHKMEEELYFGAVDTTFALYRNYRHYHLYVSARTTGKFMAHHLPWYYDYRNLPDDEIYYVQQANGSASLIDRIGKSIILGEKEVSV